MQITGASEAVQTLVAELERMVRSSLDDGSWDEARLMMSASRFGGSVGLASACLLAGSPSSGFPIGFDLMDPADALVEVLRAEVGGDVYRVRLSLFPGAPTTIEWFPDEASGFPKGGLWSDEPGYDGPSSAPKPPHRAFAHSYVASDPSAVSVAGALGRIAAWLGENTPELRPLLNPPASAQEIVEAERRWGVTFPESVREAYLVHDGQSHPNRERVLHNWLWLPLNELGDQFRWTRERPDGREVIPILESDGVSGCVRSVEEPTAESEFFSAGDGSDVVFADSFGLFLQQLAQDLEAGKYLRANGVFVPADEVQGVDDDPFE